MTWQFQDILYVKKKKEKECFVCDKTTRCISISKENVDIFLKYLKFELKVLHHHIENLLFLEFFFNCIYLFFIAVKYIFLLLIPNLDRLQQIGRFCPWPWFQYTDSDCPCIIFKLFFHMSNVELSLVRYLTGTGCHSPLFRVAR
jgi:hypothetical protein